MRNLIRSFCGVALLICFTITATAQNTNAPRGIRPEDYYSFEFVSDPRISPDGKLVAYVVTRVDRAQNRRHSSIWMVATDRSRAPWQFTTSPQNWNSPRWSPDGNWLAFLSSRPWADSAAPPPVSSPSPSPSLTSFRETASPSRKRSC